MNKKKSWGFSVVWLLAAVAVLALAGAGWYTWQKGKGTTKPAKQDTQQPAADYKGWQRYTNTAYGASFKYPAEWEITEVTGAADPSGSGINAQFSVNLQRSEDVKYSNTIAIDTFTEDFATVESLYDRMFKDGVHFTKTTNWLKERQSVQYAIPRTDAGATAVYLIRVGTGTYVFRSVNESLNVQQDAGYWDKFDKVFESLQISN